MACSMPVRASAASGPKSRCARVRYHSGSTADQTTGGCNAAVQRRPGTRRLRLGHGRLHAYYHRLAQHRRPAVERAIANLTGQQPVASAPTTTEPDEDVDDTPDPDEDVAEDDLPEEPPEA